jgi:DNA recombination protein RmuC
MRHIWDMINVGVWILGLGFLWVLGKKKNEKSSPDLNARMDGFEKTQERLERIVREDMAQEREFMIKAQRDQRQELMEVFRELRQSILTQMKDVADVQKSQLTSFSDQLDGMRAELSSNFKQLREEITTGIHGISANALNSMSELSKNQNDRLESIELKSDSLRNTVEGQLQQLRAENSKQLDEMRKTVDEKLQGTLEKRLGESFKQVSERLEQVHKGLGEMQSLAIGVGDLKKVLANVKTRGIWGEIQLKSLLEQVFHPDQYAANVATKGTNERVDFAIKLPGLSSEQEEPVWLPIDAKFPIEDYQRLIEAQERSDAEGAEEAGKQLDSRVKDCAKAISEKYLSPPRTTDFGILFLPIEGLFAEVIRRPELIDFIQRKNRVVLAGPTTLWAILNSLQMGFRTLSIQKHTSEVWDLLAAIKTDWNQYGSLLEKVQQKLSQASSTIDKVQQRSRSIGKKLRDIQELPEDPAKKVLEFQDTLDEEIESIESE